MDRPSPELLREVERRVLWLAVRMVDIANRERPRADGLKTGGHQASSASVATIATVLWFAALRRGDRVSVKPHASPVFHAIQYLLGNLDAEHLHSLRAFRGLQAYPSRTKDPDPVDYSTGSVGLGAAAPLFGGLVHRYLEGKPHFSPASGRFVAILGDAELDEGNIWEALVDPATAGLDNVLWIVDLNRQSLDRVIPGVKAAQLRRLFEESGWHVTQAKYGARLRAAFEEPGGEALRAHIDDMRNEHYQSLFTLRGAELRERFLEGADPAVANLLSQRSDDEVGALVTDLGGHDPTTLLEAFDVAEAAKGQSSVVFAYTIKGWGLPLAGHPRNHSALLSEEQIAGLRAELGLDEATELDRFPEDSEPGALCRRVAETLADPAAGRPPARPAVPVEVGSGRGRGGRSSTQEAFGRLLLGLSRHRELSERIVTTSPDVATSTNLGGWMNKVGVWAAEPKPEYADDGSLLRWREGPDGQHIELGISEMDVFMLLGQLGVSAEVSGELLLPIGTLYDPFVCRGLDALIYAAYSGARFVFAGTPSGVSLAPEGGAHQSSITPSIGVELPGVDFAEPAYATPLDWLLCDALRAIRDREEASSLYLRLSTRPIEQTPFEQRRAEVGDEPLRADVLAGGYLLREPADGPGGLLLAASGAVMPEALDAADVLEAEGLPTTLLDVTSADRLHRSWRHHLAGSVRGARHRAEDHHLARLFRPGGRPRAVVTVHDASPHALSWIGSALGVPVVPLGVERFGESGTIDELYAEHGIDAGSIVNAGLLAAYLGGVEG